MRAPVTSINCSSAVNKLSVSANGNNYVFVQQEHVQALRSRRQTCSEASCSFEAVPTITCIVFD